MAQEGAKLKHRLSFTGEVVGDVYPERKIIMMDPFVPGRTNMFDFSVVSLSKSPVAFKSITPRFARCDSKAISVKQVSASPVVELGHKGTEYSFRVTFAPNFAPPQSSSGGAVLIATDRQDRSHGLGRARRDCAA